MKESFLRNNLAWKSFLSSVAKDIESVNGINSWQIYRKNQIAFSRPIEEQDLTYLDKFSSFSAFYVSKEDIKILEQKYKVSKTKDNDIIIPIENFSLVGRDYVKIRTCINNNVKRNFVILDNYRNINDVMVFLSRWDDTSGEKHFQSRTGKNRYFFKNNLHLEGIPVFIYDEDWLIAFGVLSKPNDNGFSAYVIGKALCYDYKGLSEYADVMLYGRGKTLGVKEVNLGGGKDSVVVYKKKFPKAYEVESFDVRCTKK